MCRPVGVDGEERDSPRLSPGTETNKDRISVPFRSQRRGPDVMVGEGCVVLIHFSLSLNDTRDASSVAFGSSFARHTAAARGGFASRLGPVCAGVV